MTTEIREPMGLKIYRAVSRAAEPVANFALRQRVKAGKEDPDRLGERRGWAGRERPDGPLVWIHGASVGESLSVLPLVDRLRDERRTLNILVTTGTVTSANLMKERLPGGALHQFIPLDHPDFVQRFLDHWRPDSAIFVESEFWPNLILSTRERVQSMALVNGRISPSSYDDWKRQPNAIRFLLSSFDTIVAQDRHNAERLAALSGRDVKMFGNLKYAAPALPGDEDDVENFRQNLNGRPRWLAASTHPGEEEIAIAAHKSLTPDFPNVMTIIAPRHPARGDEIADAVKSHGLRPAQRSHSMTIDAGTDIYIADTLGELGLFYRLCDIAFVGGGIAKKGGHNPLEPARLGSAILHGPHTFNFADTYEDIRKAGGAALVRNERELGSAIGRLLADAKTRQSMVDAAKSSADKKLSVF